MLLSFVTNYKCVHTNYVEKPNLPRAIFCHIHVVCILPKNAISIENAHRFLQTEDIV